MPDAKTVELYYDVLSPYSWFGFEAFGAPTIIVHVNGEKEMIFGSDRFNLLADFIGETYEGPLTELAQIKV